MKNRYMFFKCSLIAGVCAAVLMQIAQAELVISQDKPRASIGWGSAENMKEVKNVRHITYSKPVNLPTESTSYGSTVNQYNNYTYNTQNNNNYSAVQNSQAGYDRLALSTNSAAVIVMDLQTGRPIYEKNINATRSIASITKVMTAMVVLDAGLDMREEITITPFDLNGARKASTRLTAGDRLNRSEMLLLMLMKSENPAAKALARAYPGGYEAFISAMNAKAASLGMTHTHFRDSSGLDNHNVSSASDLAKMVQAASHYDVVRNFSTIPSYDFHINNYSTGSRVYKANSTSPLVRAGGYNIGLSKTGFIREAGYCVVMQTQVNGRPAAIVLLGASASQNRWHDAENILTNLAYLK